MKTFLIKNSVEIFQDSYKDGRGEYVNYFSKKAEIKAETPLEALQQFFEKEMYFSFDEKQLDEEPHCLRYSNLVDESNIEVLEGSLKFEEFKKGLCDLYSAESSIKIYELTPIKIESKE